MKSETKSLMILFFGFLGAWLSLLLVAILAVTAFKMNEEAKLSLPPETWCRSFYGPYAYWRSPFPDEYRWILRREMIFAAADGCLDGKRRYMSEAVDYIDSLHK